MWKNLHAPEEFGECNLRMRWSSSICFWRRTRSSWSKVEWSMRAIAPARFVRAARCCLSVSISSSNRSHCKHTQIIGSTIQLLLGSEFWLHWLPDSLHNVDGQEELTCRTRSKSIPARRTFSQLKCRLHRFLACKHIFRFSNGVSKSSSTAHPQTYPKNRHSK